MNIDGNIAALNDYLRRLDAEDAWDEYVAQVGRDMKADILDGLQVCCGSYFATYDDFITVATENGHLQSVLLEIHTAPASPRITEALLRRIDDWLDEYINERAEDRANWLRG